MHKELVVLPSWQTLSLRGIEAFAAEAPPAVEGRLTLVQPDDQRLLDVRAWRSQDCVFMTIGALERGVVSAICDRGWYRPAGAGQRSHCFDVHLVHKFGWVWQSGSEQSMRHAAFETVHRLATTVTEKRAWLDMLSAAEERFRKHFVGLPVAPVLSVLSPLMPLLPIAPPPPPPQKQGGGGGGGDVVFKATATSGHSTPLGAHERGGAPAEAVGSAISPTAQPATMIHATKSMKFTLSTNTDAGRSTPLGAYKRTGGGGGAAAAAAGERPALRQASHRSAGDAAPPRPGSAVSPVAQSARRIYKRLSEQFRERTDAAERARLAAAEARVVSVDATLRASLATAQGLTAARTALRVAKRRMQIRVETLTGTGYYLRVEAGDSIGSVKQKIQDKQGIPPNQQRLATARKYHLVDHLTLMDYNIADGTTVMVRLVPAGALFLPVGKAGATSAGDKLRVALAAAQTLTTARAALRDAKAERAAAEAALLAKRAVRRAAAAARATAAACAAASTAAVRRAAAAACAAASTAALAAATATLAADAAIEAAATVARPSADATRSIGSLMMTDDIFVGIASFFALRKHTYSYTRDNGERVLIAHQPHMTPQSMDWQTMLAIGGVCRSWRKALASVAAADMWRVLHRPPSDAALQFAIRCAGDGGPTKVFASGQTMLTDASIGALHGKRNLRLLNIRGATEVTPAAVQALTWSLAQPRMAPRPDRNAEIGAESAPWDDQTSHIAFSAASAFGRLITDGGGAWKTQRKLAGLFFQVQWKDLQPVCSECSDVLDDIDRGPMCQW